MLIIPKIAKKHHGTHKMPWRATCGPRAACLRAWFTIWNLLNYTRIENAHKEHKKTFVFYYVNVICTTYWWYRTDTGLCERLWSMRLNCLLMAKLEMMHILQAVLPLGSVSLTSDCCLLQHQITSDLYVGVSYKLNAFITITNQSAITLVE